MTNAAELRNAPQKMSTVPSFPPDRDGLRYTHSGSGSMSVNTGAGMQRNNVQTGDSGSMLNCEQMHIGTGTNV